EAPVAVEAPAADAVLDVNGQPPAPEPVSSVVTVTIEGGATSAFASLSAPQNGGEEVSIKMIRVALAEAGVTYGIMEQAVNNMVTNKPYNRKMMVAVCTPKEDGVDAVITELFPHEQEIAPHLNHDGTVDFKQMGVIREIKKDAVIATMTLPTQGVDGIDVRGEPIRAVPGRQKKLSKAGNTTITPDGLQLLAAENGNLIYKNERFDVDTVFVVEESVDNNTGDISFCGDVLVKGDVREGYKITAGGSIHVKGVVEGGNIVAEGAIQMDGGFNGMKRGSASSQKGIVSKFLQNCNVYAKEDIVTEAVINSILDCDAQLTVTKGKGTIVGGRCTALRGVEANIIGSDVNTPTTISVGLSPTVLAQKAEAEKGLRELEDSKEALHKNLVYLERCAKMGPLSPKNQALVESCNKQKVLNLVREGRLTRQSQEIAALIEEAGSGCCVKAKTVYPSTKVSIQNCNYITREVNNRVIFRRDAGEIVMATY
ncbi:MAG: FapA family protein, partial [Angelakisella sp.]